MKKNNDRNDNGIPDDIDKTILWFFVGQAIQTILLIAGLMLLSDVISKLK